MEKERFSGMFMDWVMTFLVVAILATVCNIVGYDGGFIESLPGMLIFGLISLAGLTVKHFVPGNLPAVAYIAFIGMIGVLSSGNAVFSDFRIRGLLGGQGVTNGYRYTDSGLCGRYRGQRLA